MDKTMQKCYNVRITGKVQNISRKLDIGVDILKGIKNDTSALPDIKVGIDNLNTKFDSFATRFDSYITEQQEHNQRLEKILEKLAER